MASVKSAELQMAFVRYEWLRSALLNDVKVALQSDRLALVSLACWHMLFDRLALVRSARCRFADVRLALHMMASQSFACTRIL